MNDRLLLCSDVAKLCGVTAAAVRLWERTGKLRAERTASGVRLFKRRDVNRFTWRRARLARAFGIEVEGCGTPATREASRA